MKHLRTNTQSGFSLIELLIVMAVLGVIVTFAILTLGNSKEIIQRQTIAKEFKVTLERSRFDSVKRRPANCSEMARVEITSATSFRYITDLDQDGTLNPATESRVVDFGNRSNVQIVENPAPTYPIIIRFNQHGETSSGACGSEVTAHTPTVFCQSPCTTVSETNASTVYVSPTGTVALLKGGESLPTFTAPTESDVPSDSLINRFLAVWTGTPPTPTPFPTPVGSGSPTPTATPAGTPARRQLRHQAAHLQVLLHRRPRRHRFKPSPTPTPTRSSHPLKMLFPAHRLRVIAIRVGCAEQRNVQMILASMTFAITREKRMQLPRDIK